MCQPYLALLGAGFQRQTTYRLALAAGLAANAFFGVVRTAIFFALYRERDQVAGLEVADLTLEEPDIEDIVRRIYRGESPWGSGGLRPSPPA
jgi:hypothetical protein